MHDRSVADTIRQSWIHCARHAELWLLLTVCLSFSVGIALRSGADWSRELWGDEVFTGTIASSASPSVFVRDCLTELSGPVYYGFMWVWTKLAGLSNVALRLPSFVFSVAAPLLILWRGHPSRNVRLVWAALSATFLPLCAYMTEARSYTLLFLLGTGQTILFQSLLRDPSSRRAWRWTAISAGLTLTHYFTVALTGVQGFLLLLVLRGSILRYWRSLLVFLPVGIWMAFHLPTLVRFSQPGTVWQPLLTFSRSTFDQLTGAMLGLNNWSLPVLAALGATLAWDLFNMFGGKKAWTYDRFDTLVAGASFAAFLTVTVIGFVKPSFAARYIMSFLPGVIFAIAIWANRYSRVSWVVPIAVMILFILPAARESARLWRTPSAGNVQGAWESASGDLMVQGVNKVVFLLDDPAMAVIRPELSNRVSRFFFDRAGRKVQFLTLSASDPDKDRDPNTEFLATLGEPNGSRRQALLWIYNRESNGRSMADRHRPDHSLMAGRVCRDYGRGSMAVVSCVE